ncbi:MAG: hypothetical protein FKY71_20370 [Spiribacter salinus]|uniref:Uncharacterized protein n=1 Tax=Spiribacter salinus TaxID=1335746 RepID=A0A540V1Q8_9GAMM|nr:MAG: hypothetical protein FKY71_20370 [Spiribacter salinus]
MSRRTSTAEMVSTVKWRLAVSDYLRWNDRSKLDELLKTQDYIPPLARKWLADLVFGDVKRPRGKPPKVRFNDRQIVQLVFKAQLQGGCGFDNKNGDEGNESFCFVAENLGVHPSDIRRRFYRVAEADRQAIRAFIADLLADGGN